MTDTTATEIRDSGLSVVGDVPWGTHFSLYYNTPDDLLDVVVPFLAAGLRNNEECFWIPSNPEAAGQARAALRALVPDLDGCLTRGQLEFIDAPSWYRASGHFSV